MNSSLTVRYKNYCCNHTFRVEGSIVLENVQIRANSMQAGIAVYYVKGDLFNLWHLCIHTVATALLSELQL